LKRVSHRGHREHGGRALKGFVLCLLPFYFCLAGCGVPNLETPECSEAKGVAREFYSFHFGDDMRPSAETVESRARFLTPRLNDVFRKVKEGNVGFRDSEDYFTSPEPYPRAFRVGKCTPTGPNEVEVTVQLFWRDERETLEKAVTVSVNKLTGRWLIDKVIKE
jgi:hypothetical protein